MGCLAGKKNPLTPHNESDLGGRAKGANIQGGGGLLHIFQAEILVVSLFRKEVKGNNRELELELLKGEHQRLDNLTVALVLLHGESVSAYSYSTDYWKR